MLACSTPFLPSANAHQGEAHHWWEPLSAAMELVSADAALISPQLQNVRSLPGLRQFLHAYMTQILQPLEWPAIVRAHGHAAGNEWRELLALDQQLAREKNLRDFAVASCRVGQRQLNRLRPLRDQRLIQRYLQALEAGQAYGWHTLVYGISLQIFALPLRQGLWHYSYRSGWGFITAAAGPLRLDAEQSAEILEEIAADWPTAMNELLDALARPRLLTT
jgi:urease accessory protein UreF